MKNIKNVWIINGMAINIICKGLLKIISPWNEKIITKVRSKPTIVTLSNFLRKMFSKYSILLCLMMFLLVRYPPANGITTNRIVDNISVS